MTTTEVMDSQLRRRSRLKLVAILGAFAFPLLLATLWLHYVRSTGGSLGLSARGELIHPAVPMQAFSADERGAAAFSDESLRGIWTWVYAPEGDCDNTCQTNLYHMRQVRLSLGHRMDRVQRVIVLGDGQQLSDNLLDEHNGLRVLTAGGDGLVEQIRSAEKSMPQRDDAMYLIDPFGNLMMRIPADLPPKSMLKDIKHLLKVSRIG